MIALARVHRNVIPVRSNCSYECLQVQALKLSALDVDGFRPKVGMTMLGNSDWPVKGIVNN